MSTKQRRLTHRRAGVVVELRAADAVLVDQRAIAQVLASRASSSARRSRASTRAPSLEPPCAVRENSYRCTARRPEAVERRPTFFELDLAEKVLAQIDGHVGNSVSACLARRVDLDPDVPVHAEVVEIARRLGKRAVAVPVAAPEAEQVEHDRAVDLARACPRTPAALNVDRPDIACAGPSSTSSVISARSRPMCVRSWKRPSRTDIPGSCSRAMIESTSANSCRCPTRSPDFDDAGRAALAAIGRPSRDP